MLWQVLAQDYPQPAIETSGPYLEAAALSAKLREAPRPERPLRVVIAGAGGAGMRLMHMHACTGWRIDHALVMRMAFPRVCKGWYSMHLYCIVVVVQASLG